MEVYYSSRGIPLVIKDGVAYEVTAGNIVTILADVALDIELFNSIKNNVISTIKTLGEKTNEINAEDNSAIISKKIDDLFYISQFNSVLNVLSEAEDIQQQVINPQPYPSWQWDRLNKTWVPPVERPQNISDEDILWDESLMTWRPNSESPYNEWIWSWETQSWNPPIAYPLGAEENEFIWSNEAGTWVLNEQIS
jgi:hypothetical protein